MGELTLLFALIGVAIAQCPCQDPSWCNPITTGKRKEVFGFHYPDSGTNWKQYDWTQLTTVAWSKDQDLMCFAHSKGARVVLQASFDASILTNATARQQWITNHVQTALTYHLDGTNFDYESPLPPNDPRADDYRQLISDTTAAFHSAIPGSQVSVDVAWSPNNIDGRYYDIPGMAAASDLLFVMAYDERSQIFDQCIASANSPLVNDINGISQFLGLGISPDKLILGLPWYGYDYQCLNGTDPASPYCPIKQVPFRGVNCSDAAGTQKYYPTIMKLLRGTTVTGRVWEPYLQTPYFNYIADDKSLHQVWYDDPQSLTTKYQYAKDTGLIGVGFWNLDELDYSSDPQAQADTKAQWDAIKTFTSP
jgi:di-N-acetylchitobiase